MIEPTMKVTINVPIDTRRKEAGIEFNGVQAFVDKINKEYGRTHTLYFEINLNQSV